MLAFLKARIGSEERGFALIMVITIGAVLLILASVAVAASVSGTMKARTDQASDAALAAAYAGIDEYQSRLSNDSFYVQYGNPDADFTGASDVEMPPTGQENAAFGIDAGGSWAQVNGSGGTAQYRYEVNTENYLVSGTIRVRSTGLVNGVTRSIIADVRQTGFIDFLYFTDYEIQDPLVSGKPASCVKWERSGRAASCGDIRFGDGDVINGPMHTNDTLLVCEAEFNGVVTTSNNRNMGGGRLYNIPSGCGAADFNYGPPSFAPTIGMPTTNSDMKRETRYDLLTSGVPSPGCLYTGPTKIVFNSGGTMTVRSPWSKVTQIIGDPETSGRENAACGTKAALRSAAGATVTVPERNLVYVQAVPTESSNPNSWGRYESGKPTCPSNGNPIGYPLANETSYDSSSYGCTNGDVFVEGTMHGALTIASDNYTYITGDLVYSGDSDDILGLVSFKVMWVYNPVNRWGSSMLPTDPDGKRNIDAAMISVNNTFQVQNYDSSDMGDRGILSIKGAIAQKFRGPVGTSNSVTHVRVSGYDKDYNYDPRLKYTAPPKFLSPTTTTYGVTTWMDTPAAMNADGSYR